MSQTAPGGASRSQGPVPAKIYHAVQQHLWDEAKAGGKEYLPPTYYQDGFIHATHDPKLLLDVLNLFYKDDRFSYLVLEIDTDVLQTAVIMEPPAPVGNKPADGSPAALFPHVYGAIKPLTCVVSCYEVERAPDGTFLKILFPEKPLAAPAAKPAGRPKPPPKTGLAAVLAEIKSLQVVQYTYGFTRDLLDSNRLRGRTDYVRKLLAMCWPFGLKGDGDSRCKREILALALLGVLKMVLMNKSIAVLNKLFRAVINKTPGALQQQLGLCCLITAAGSLCNALYSFNEESLEISFRTKLKQVAHAKYFRNAAYYHVAGLPGKEAFDNCDSLITTDVVYIASRLVSLVSAVTAAVPPIFWFTYKLYKMRGLSIAFVPHLYLAAAYEVAQRFFPKDIGLRSKNLAVRVGQYRRAASRVQSHAEAIIAAGGTEREADILDEKFEGTIQVQKDLQWVMSKFQLIFKVAYSYGCRAWMGAFGMAGLMSVTGMSQAAQIALVSETNVCILESLIANGKILTMHAQQQQMFLRCRSFCQMLDSLDKTNKMAAQKNESTLELADTIKFEGVEVCTPVEPPRVLVEELSWELPHGKSLLLTGHNGAGKSSIFRCLGELWPIAKGTISRPGATATPFENLENIFYVPQRPYLSMGTIADQVTYPIESRLVDISKPELEALLDLVMLSDLKKYGDKHFTNLEEVLSRGEQQRLAIARLFFHSPKFAILDECTSAVSREMEQLMYSECERRGISYITICHRPALKAYHDANLNLLGNGRYEMVQLKRQSLAAASAEASTSADASSSELAAEQRTAKMRTELSPLQSNKQPRSASALTKFVTVLKAMLPGSGYQLARLLVTIGVQTLCAEGMSRLAGMMIGKMLKKDKQGFYLAAVGSFCLAIVCAFVEEYVGHLQNGISLTWSCTLSKKLRGLFFKNNAFYSMKQIDKSVLDADQRITEELHELSTDCSALWSNCITPLINSVWFTYRLQSLLGVTAMRPFYMYVAGATVLLRMCLPDHTALKGKEKELEAQFAHVHSRLSMHRESVAFFGGDEMEHKIADKSLDELTTQMRKTRAASAQYRFVAHCITPDGGYSHVVSVSDLVSMQMQLSIASGVSGVAAGSLEYVSSVSRGTFQAFSKLFTLYETFSSLQGSVSRIYDLLQVMSETPTPPNTAHGGDDIVLKQVSVMTPGAIQDSTCLVQGLDLQISPGQSTIITGASGSGKSSLFRVLAGLWPLWPGTGSVQCPESVMLVPQRPYFVTGSLRDQVTYPSVIKGELDHQTMNRLEEALELAGVSSLPTNYGGWDKVQSWEEKLSGGEQQRLCLARVFFHRPTFVILDECTDAVNVEAEEKLYTALHSVNVTCITISKRLALPELHHRELQLGVGDQGWCANDLSLKQLLSKGLLMSSPPGRPPKQEALKLAADAAAQQQQQRAAEAERLAEASRADAARAKKEAELRNKQAQTEREAQAIQEEHAELALVAAARQRALDAFTAADPKEVGVLSHTEVKKLVRANPGLREEFEIGSWKDFFNETDKDQDGTVSAEEFAAYCVSHRTATVTNLLSSP